MYRLGWWCPCDGCWEREKILPARGKWPDFVDFGCAGRVLYRLGSVVGVAGRVLYRLGQGRLLLGEFCTGCWLVPRAERVVGGVLGRVLYRLGPVAGVAGRVLYRVSGGLVLEAGKNSPCSVAQCWEREKILPAREKWPDFVDFGCAGRVLYRLGSVVGVAGRVLYRLGQGRLLLGEFCTGCWLVPRAERVVGGVLGRVLYRLGPVAGVAGRVLYRVSGGLVLEAGKNSPCSVAQCWEREKILPAREKWPDFGVFGRAGRVLYRVGPCVGLVGGGFVVWSPASPEISR